MSRAYLLRVPLQGDGSVDIEALRRNPERAGVRRFWPNEADLSGQLYADAAGTLGIRIEDDDGELAAITNEVRLSRVVAGEIVELCMDGAWLPFKVVSIKQL